MESQPLSTGVHASSLVTMWAFRIDVGRRTTGTTSCPIALKCWHSAAPMNPLAPVTNILMSITGLTIPIKCPALRINPILVGA